jgi:hypothetical protein
VAEDVSAASATAAAAPAPGAETLMPGRERRRERARRSSYRLRFALLYAFLAAVVGAGASAFAVLELRDPPADAAAWSSWQPTGSPEAMLRQIADRVPQAYRQNGEQLVVSTASNLAVPTEQGEIPVESVFVEPDTSLGLADEDDITTYDGTKVASFALCGLGDGEQCAITTGKPSAERFTFLSRLVLELSLYTFKFVEDVESVLVFMPPTPDGQNNGAIFLTRDDVADELARPLGQVLTTRKPTVGKLDERDEATVLRITEPRTYAVQVQAAPNGSPIVVLSPPVSIAP